MHSRKIVGSSSTSLKRTFENSFLIPQPNPRRLPTHNNNGFVKRPVSPPMWRYDFEREDNVGWICGLLNHSKKVYSAIIMTPQKTLPIFAPPKIKDGENFPKKQIVQRDFLGTWSFPPHDLDNEKPPG